MKKSRKPRKDGGYIINVSFTDKEVDLIEHVDSKGNFSNYVKLLIRKDMEGKTSNNNMDLAMAMQQLLKMAGEQKPTAKSEEEKPKEEKKQKVSKLAINNILNKNY